MRKYPIVLDLETKHTFREYSEHEKLGVTVVGVYNYEDKQFKIYRESTLNQLFPVIENSSYVIGFNNRSFDLPVLQAYYPGDLKKMPVFDILEDVRDKIGRRLSLNDLISATLGLKKSGHGLMAIDYYREGKWEELEKYCLDDVSLTKDLFEYGVKNQEINYLSENGKLAIKVDWKKYLEENKNNNDVAMTLPF